MKQDFPKELNKYRIRKGPWASKTRYGFNGAFVIPYRNLELRVIVADGMGWDHVSVSLKNRCPTWQEMCFIKDLFFDPEETVIQFHPPKSQYVNVHPNCLHLWRQQGATYQLPPTMMLA